MFRRRIPFAAPFSCRGIRRAACVRFLPHICGFPRIFSRFVHIIKAHCAIVKKNKAHCAINNFAMISIYDVQARLRDAIKNSGLSQKELAGRLGIDPSTVSKYMRLDKFPSLDTFANLCEVLDISADDILGLKK